MSRPTIRLLAAFLLALVLPAGSAPGQSLGELAENTKKKRKGGVPVYSDGELKKHSPTPSPSPGSPTAPAASDAAAAGGSGEGGEGSGAGGADAEGQGRSSGRNDEAYWRAEAARHRAAMKGAEQRIAAVQKRLNALMADLVPTNLGDPFQQQTLEAERARARQELDEAEKELERAEDAFQAFEEEARVKGVPPGWVEER